MQTLGIGTPEERSDSRIKSLFWPSVRNDVDIDYLTTQGFWLCVFVGTMTLVVGLAGGNPAVAFDALFFYLGGIGVRQRSIVAAVSVLVVYALSTFVGMAASYAGGGSGSVLRVLATALLLSNVRAVWLASKWRKSGVADESPAAIELSFMDRFSDVMPARVWPWTRIVFYVFAFLEVAALLSLLLMGLDQHNGRPQ
jgi:hypothetical protein